MSVELMPCPWCGGEASSEGRVNYNNSTRKKSDQNQFWGDGTPVDTAYFCNCKRCACSNKGIIGYRTKEEAITAWNHRTTDPRLEVAIEALEKAEKFCDSLPAEICPDSVAIPITEALAKIKGEE